MRKIWNTMLKGLVAMLPIGLTVYLVYWLATTAERLFSRVIKLVIPDERLLAGPRACSRALLVLYFVGLAVNAYVGAPRAAPERQLFAPHPGREDDLRRDPRLHALLPLLRPGQRPEARGAGAVRAGQGHRLRHGGVGRERVGSERAAMRSRSTCR